MTDQSTAPQTWETLPDDPDAIPFPIVVGWDSRLGTVMPPAFVVDDIDVWASANSIILKHVVPDWWMPWPTFAPDPMTVNQWHDMALLPDGHDEFVYIEYEDGYIVRDLATLRKFDAEFGRKRWRSEAAMLAHVGGTVEGAS